MCNTKGHPSNGQTKGTWYDMNCARQSCANLTDCAGARSRLIPQIILQISVLKLRAAEQYQSNLHTVNSSLDLLRTRCCVGVSWRTAFPPGKQPVLGEGCKAQSGKPKRIVDLIVEE